MSTHTLPPTPRSPAQTPLPAPGLVDGATAPGVHLGKTHADDEVTLREISFVAQRSSAPAMVHINSITDAHRSDITAALLTPVPGTDLAAVSYLLPDDGVWSYRFVSHPDLHRDIGQTRDGWRRVHEWGRPDPANPEQLPNPLGDRSSVLTLSGARVHPEWSSSTPDGRGWTRQTRTRLPDERVVTLHHRDTPAPALLVLLDGHIWEALEVNRALAPRADEYDVLLIPSGTHAQRAEDLPDPARSARLIETAIDQVSSAHGAEHRPWPAEHTVIAGQSYGGLAAANTVVRRPDLARTAVAQSGSFWHRSDAEVFGEGEGELLSHLARATTALSDVRAIVQVGSDEGDMVSLSRTFTHLARASGAQVTHDEFRGGHDYAWWRHGLSFALDELPTRLPRAPGCD